MNRFDILVVGAGHAGCEAALAAAKLGRRVALITLRREQVGRLSCNPAIGGLAKGCLVREIDALGGVMGRVADEATIQFRRLNTRKGLAVQASRAQVDIDLYPKAMARKIAACTNITLIEGEATEIRMTGGRVTGLRLGNDEVLDAGAVVLTTGTFLGGVLHRGSEQTAGGRVGESAAYALSNSMRELGLGLGRLKTGTTPRLRGASIDWSKLEAQAENVAPGSAGSRFSFGPPQPRPGTIQCFIGYSSGATHDVIRAGLSQSPLYTGAITGRGPRYCPSIEDKVVRFSERDRHQIFLEPEGLSTDRVYVNGASTSLPRSVQDEFLRTIPGLEQCEVLEYGYAVEYDMVDPTQLGHDLQVRNLPGLFLAGQINGTSGYEEAAAQGLVAGVNAAGCPFRLGREDAYIGVLVDDLVTRGVGGEPYRMFPSRAEHRLHLREDNADRRLTSTGRALGLIDDTRWMAHSAHLERIAGLMSALDRPLHPSRVTNEALDQIGIPALSRSVTLRSLLARPELDATMLESLFGFPDPEALQQVEVDVKYAGYLDRDRGRRAEAEAMSTLSLAGLDFAVILTLSSEVRERLTLAQPATLADAARLPGVTPAAIDALAMTLARSRATALG
jgi:tRNA uridine 5-carboxymethylaminomethyl modification enzyme